jgi:hypothetical protein
MGRLSLIDSLRRSEEWYFGSGGRRRGTNDDAPARKRKNRFECFYPQLSASLVVSGPGSG